MLKGKMPIDSVEIGTAQIKAALRAAEFAAILLQFRRAVGAETQGGAAIGTNSGIGRAGYSGSDRVRRRAIHAR